MKALAFACFAIFIAFVLLFGCAAQSSQAPSLPSPQSNQPAPAAPSSALQQSAYLPPVPPNPPENNTSEAGIPAGGKQAGQGNVVKSLPAFPGECKNTADLAGCLEYVSLEKSDVGYCNLIPDEMYGIPTRIITERCTYERLLESDVSASSLCAGDLDLCYNYVALRNNDVESCKLIGMSDGRDWCLANVAIQSNDGSKCGLISDANIGGFCVAVINSNSSACSNPALLGWVKDDCFEEIAIKAGSAGLCANIADGTSKLRCEGTALKNPDKCGGVSDADYKNYCYEALAVRLGDSGICSRISGTALTSASDETNYCMALAGKDKSYCEKIDGSRSPSEKSDCRINVNLLKKGGPTLNFNGPITIR